MRVPQVSERIKEAPAQALRGVFAGIGQLLLITDKLRNKTPASQQVPRARAPEPPQTHAETAPAPVSSVPSVPASAAPAAPAPAPATAAPAAAAPAAAAPVAAASVAAASAAAASAAPATAAAASAAAAPGAGRVRTARNFDKTGNVRLLTSAEAAGDDTAPAVDAPVGKHAAVAEHAAAAEAAAPAAEAEAEAAPLPNYDELSIASLRARLRNLDATELRQLVEYEQAHADRADVIAMFERRIAKLDAETSADRRGEAEAEAEIEAREEVEAEVQEDVGAEAEGEE
jgi:hypothetical protein